MGDSLRIDGRMLGTCAAPLSPHSLRDWKGIELGYRLMHRDKGDMQQPVQYKCSRAIDRSSARMTLAFMVNLLAFKFRSLSVDILACAHVHPNTEIKQRITQESMRHVRAR